MPSELDRRYDKVLAELIAPGGRLQIGMTSLAGRSSPTSRRRYPSLFRTFCQLNAANEAVVAGDERLTFSDLDRISERLAHGWSRAVSARAIASHRHAQLPGVGRQPYGHRQGGAVATLLNGWWEAHEMEHAISLTDPKMIIADASRAAKIAERCAGRDIVSLPSSDPSSRRSPSC